MADIKINARDWTFEVHDGANPGVLLEIPGVNSMTLGRATEETETTDFDSGGHRESEPMQRHRTFQIQGQVREDSVTGALPAAHARLEALADAVGTAALTTFVITSPGGRKFTQKCWVEPGDQSGDTNNKTTFSYTLVRSGATVA